jgi:hypothetical protein
MTLPTRWSYKSGGGELSSGIRDVARNCRRVPTGLHGSCSTIRCPRTVR